jgi:hydrogenase maturation protease
MVSHETRVLVLGVGNDLLGDDAVGLHVARVVREELGGAAGCTVSETTETGLALLDEIAGYDHLIVTDAIETGATPPGGIHEFDDDTLSDREAAGPHFVGLGEVLALGRSVGLPMPHTAHVVAVEVKDGHVVGSPLSPEVQHAVRVAAARICEHVHRWVDTSD